MNQTEIFMPEPFPRESATEQLPGSYDSEFGNVELEEELRRGSSVRSRSGAGRSRPSRGSAAQRRTPRRPGLPRPRPWPGRPVAPWPIVQEPFPAPGEPEPGAGPAEPQGSEHVRWTQDCLNRVMSAQLPVDGVMTPATRSVVRSFQQRENLPVTGIVGPDTEEALKRACSGAPSQPSGDIQADQELGFETPFEYGESAEWREELDGSARDQVRWAQGALNEVVGIRLSVDGMPGPATRSAIRSFQRRQGLPVTGVLEAETEAALGEVRRDAEAEADAMLELETLGPLTAELKWLPENDHPKLYSLENARKEPGGGVYIALDKRGKPLKVGITNSFDKRLYRYEEAASKIGGVWFYLAQIKRGRIGGLGIAGAANAIEYAIARTLLRAGRELRWHRKPFKFATVTGTVDIRNILPKPLATLVSKAFTATGADPRGRPIRTYPSPASTDGLRLLESRHPKWEA